MSWRDVSRRCALVFLGSLLLGSCGCKRTPKAEVIGLDPVSVATEIIKTFDKDGNGSLSKAEVKASGSLQPLAENKASPLDSDGDGEVSQGELEKKIEDFVNVNRVTCRVVVLHKGQPLSGAEVRFIPEPFMGGSLEEALGETGDDGLAEISDGTSFGGMASGIYRVEVTHPTITIDPKFNTDSNLRRAVDGTNPYAASMTIQIR